MSTKENRRVVLSLTVRDARLIADALYQNYSSSRILNIVNEECIQKGHINSLWKNDDLEAFSEETSKAARAVYERFMELYTNGTMATSYLDPFDEIYGRPSSFADFSLYSDNDVEIVEA